MKFHYTNLETCHEATGVVVVIDVIRAFTNAAFAFSRGAKEIHPVSTVEEALQFKAQTPNSLACGEVGGLPPEGFDFGNSPSHTKELDLTGKIIVQRTGAGTQGIVRSVKAETILAASLVVASATIKYIRKLAPTEAWAAPTRALAAPMEEEADHHFQSRAMARLLRDRGHYNVTAVGSGEQALESLLSGEFDVALLDVSFEHPVMR